VRYIMTIVEQLDRAAHELATDHPINNRLALILIDNVIELILYNHCIDLLKIEDYVRVLSPKQRTDIKNTQSSKHTQSSKRLKVFEELGKLSSTERDFIKMSHGYRNELYHIGLSRDDIIRPVAGEYFILSCNLFARFKPHSSLMRCGEPFSEVAARYIPLLDGKPDFQQIEVEKFAEALRSILPSNIAHLPSELGKSALNAIEEVEEALGYVIHEVTPTKAVQQAELRRIQFLFDVKPLLSG
jgi:hypothetical protein